MLFKFFNRQKQGQSTDIENWYKPQSSEALLDTEYRKKLLSFIWQQVAMTKEQFNKIYLIPIHRYTELVQLLPASEAHHHSHLGGMLDHGLEVINFAMKIRKSYLLPIGASTEEQSEQSEAWSVAVMYGALLHDIGKIIVDVDVKLISGEKWNPWDGKISEEYRFKYITNREYKLHSVASAFICHTIISPFALNWLSKYKELFSSLLYCLSGHYENAGILGEIIQKADQASVSQNLGGDPTKVLIKPQISLAKQIIQALRYLVKHELSLNNSTSGSDGWLIDDVLWLVNKTVADKIRVNLYEQGITSIPSSNSKLFDELSAHNIVIPTKEGRAVWTCKIESAQPNGICFEKMTLLQVPASIAWDSIENRPDPFNGTVTPVATENQTDIFVKKPIQPQEILDNKETNNEKVAELDNFMLALFDNNESINIETGIEKENDKKTLHIEAKNNNLNDQIDEILNKNIELPSNNLNSDIDINIGKISELSDDNIHPFIKWIRLSLLKGTMELNTPKAKIHTVENRVFLVSPGIFKQYLIEKNGNEDNWEELQKEFQKLKLHKKLTKDGLNIWKCKVTGPRKSCIIKGYLLNDSTIILGQQVLINNPHLKIINES